MASINIPASDKGVLSHGEELEREAMNTTLTPLPPGFVPTCPWKAYETCRNCGLYGECFKLEAKT